MRVLVAPDSFKECMDARSVAEAMRDGIVANVPGSEVHLVPMADGGEGTLDVLAGALGCEFVTAACEGPLGAPLRARYGLAQEHAQAVVESAAACGLELLAPAERDPLRASTRGVGMLLADARARGARGPAPTRSGL